VRQEPDTAIGDVARLTGITSRTLRHYDDIGLLPATRTGPGGVRRYDGAALVRLQRILLLRELGVPLPRIGAILDGHTDNGAALRVHLGWLRAQRERIDRQITSVERTVAALSSTDEGGRLMAQDMLDGFDHTQYRQEVDQRWGTQAYDRSDRWWRALDSQGRQEFLAQGTALGEDWRRAYEEGVPVDDARALALAQRHADWVAQGWGGTRPDPDALLGLGELYVADPRFAAHYGGAEGAAYVRDVLQAYAVAQA
jgi:DNA-binding transcriptional MerR regulator